MYYKEDFVCSKPETLESGSGMVFSIARKSIIVATNNGFRIILNLSACSRMESLDKLPKFGQQIQFRGKKIRDLEYNLFKATFF